MMSRRGCTLRREVSISRSATEAIGSRSARSMVIASRRPTSLRLMGCLRRVSAKRRSSSSSAATRKITSHCRPLRLSSSTSCGTLTTYERTAIGLDARNTAAEVASVPQLVDELKRSGLQCEVIFLVAAEDELLRRFAETRRKHPMSRSDVGLREAMTMERSLLEPIASVADLLIDTSRLSVHAEEHTSE